MKLALSTIAVTAALVAPTLAEARQVTFQTTLKNYGGNNADVVIWVTDAAGKYKGTLWMAGNHTKYWRHLSDWYAASRGRPSEVDGITGASIGSGRTLKITLDIADALIDAGYSIRIDTAAEDGRDNPSEIVAPLTSANNGKAVAGRGYVKSFTASF